VIRSLPESFGGTQNSGVAGSASVGNIGNQNISNASTVNLRGLGSDATLVLLDDHRMASDAFYQAPDIYRIPLAAIERSEVLTDGACALYGSDVVADVTNIILRKDFTGVDVSARGGYATSGGELLRRVQRRGILRGRASAA
jgi:iron complex outermembrane receptor protein